MEHRSAGNESISTAYWLPRMIAGELAVVAVPVFAWLTSGYDIVPDLGRLSLEQKVVIVFYAAAFIVSVIFAAYATFRCFSNLWRMHYNGKSSKLNWLLLLPVPGCLFIPVILFNISFRTRGAVRLCSIIYLILSVLSVTALTVLYFAAIKWVPTVAVFMLPILYVLMLYIVYALSRKPVFSLISKSIIALLLAMLIGPLVYTGFFLHGLKTGLIAGREKLESVYQRKLNGATLREIYYHGEKANIHKFSKILSCNEKEGDIDLKIKVPENLEIFYFYTLTNSAQQKELAEWIKKNQDSLNEFDRLLREEKYLKVPDTIRDYDGLIAGIILPSLYHLRQFARIYLMKGQNAIYNHASQAAFKAYLASHRPLEYALDDHFEISSLVGMAIEAIRLEQLKVLVESNMLSEKQIKLIMSQLQHDMNLWSKQFDISMFSNAVCVIDSITSISRPDNEYMLFETGYFSKETDYRKMEDEFFDFNEYLLKFFLAPVVSVYSEDLLYAVDSLILGEQHPLPPEYSKLNNNIPAKFLLSKLVLVDLSTKFYKKFVMIRSQQQAAVMGLGVELYRRKYGKLPESLDSLVPEFIDKVYIDQFSGQPFKYIKGKYQLKLYDYRKGYFPENKAELFEVQGYNIYSVGINERDDGGVYDKIDHRNHDDQGFSFIEKIGSLKH